MKSKRFVLVGITSLMSYAASAAPIAFSSAANLAGDSDVSTAGTFKYGYTWAASNQTVNGVTFTSTAVSGGAVGTNLTLATLGSVNNNAFTSTSAPFSSLSTAYKAMLIGSVYNGTTNTTGSVTLNNLVVGRTYQVQVWVGDPRSGATATRVQSITSTGGNTQVMDFNSTNGAGGVGQHIVGTFTADATTQAFTLPSSGGNLPQMNAIQVREFSSPQWSGETNSTWNDANVNFSGLSFTAAKAVNGTVFFNDINGSGGAVTNSNLTLQAGGVTGAHVQVGNTGVNYTFTGADANGLTGAYDLTKFGSGSLTLASANTFSGTTTHGLGTLTLGNTLSLQNSTLNLQGGTVAFSGITSATVGGLSGTSALALTNTTPAAVALTAGGNNLSTTYSGVLSGTGSSLVKTGTGTLTLSGANTYTGGTTISQGTLVLGSNSGAGTGTITLGNAGTGANNVSLLWTPTAATQTTSSNIVVSASGTGTATIGTSTGVADNQTFSGTVALNRPTTLISGNATVNNRSNFSGVISGNVGTLTISGSTASRVVFSGTGANTFTGDVVVDSTARFQVGVNSTANHIPDASNVTVAGIFNLALNSGGTETINALNGAGTVGNGGSNANTLAIGSANGSGTFSGVINNSGSVVNLTKLGSGTQTLSGANTYVGSTTVSGGVLAVSGASGALGNTALTIGTGGTFKIDNTGAANSGARIHDSAAITLTGGTLQFENDAAAATNFSETVGAVTVPPGFGGTIATSQAAVGQTSTLTLSGLTGFANFTGTGLGVDGRNTILITGKAQGALLGTYNGIGQAVYDTTLGVTEAAYTDVPFAGTISDGPATDIRLTGGTSGDVVLGSAITTVNSIFQNQTSATVIDNASKTLRMGAGGGILLPTGMASLSIGTTPDSGVLTAGGADNTAGTLNLANSDTTALLTINSGITDNGSGVVGVATAGTGRVVLAGTNTYNGTTFLGAAITEFSGGTQTLSGVVSGTGLLVKSNAATTLMLSGANTYTGNTAITGGTLQISGTGTLGTGAYAGAIANDGTLRFSSSTAQTLSGVISGTGGLTKDTGAGTLTLSGANTFTGTVDVDTGILTSAAAGGTGNSFLGGTGTALNRRTVNIASGAQVTYTSGTVNGFLNLGGSYGSFYDINVSGTLAINDAAAVSQILQSTYHLSNGGVITNTGVASNGNYGLLFGWNGAGGGNLNVTGTGNQITADRVCFLNGATITTNSGAELTITAVLGGTNATALASSLTKAGPGLLTLTGINIYTGNTTINGGTVVLSGANAALANTAITIGTGGTLKLDNTGAANKTTRLSDTSTISLAGGTLQFANDAAAATNFSESVGAVTTTLGGSIATSQAAVGQTSTLTLGGLTGSTNFTGTGLGVDGRNKILITGKTQGAMLGTINGTAQAVYDTTLGVTEATFTDVPFAGTINDGPTTNILLNGGTSGNVLLGSATTTVNLITQNQTSATVIDNASQTLRLGASGGILLPVGKASLSIGTIANSGILTAGGADNTAGTLTLTNNDATALLTLNSAITNNGSGVVSLASDGLGRVLLTGTNLYTGTTTIGAGTLEIGGAGTLGAGGVYAANITNSATLKYNSTAAQTLSGVISGGGALVKDAASTLMLTGVNTYSGGTTVTAGTLQIGNGTASSIAGAVSIDSAAILRYNTLSANNAATRPLWAGITGGGTIALTTAGSGTGTGDWGLAALPTGFTGTLLIEKGRVTSNTQTSLGNATAVVVQTGGHLGMWQGGTFPQNFTVIGTGYGEAGYESALRLANASITTTITGTVTLTGNTTLAATGTGILSNTISETTASALTFGTSQQAGVVVLSGENTYTGATTVAMGTLSVSDIGNAGESGNLGTNATINLGATTTQGILTYTGAGETTDRVMNFSGTTGGATINSDGAGLLQFTANTTTTGSGAKGITFGGAGNGQLDGTMTALGGLMNVSKAGAGTWTLNGNLSTAGGAVTVNTNGGTLVLTGTNSYTGVTRVNTGGTLSVGTLANGGVNSNIGASTNAAANLFFGGGTLRYTGPTVTTDRSLTANAASTLEVTNAGTNLTIANGAAMVGGSVVTTKTGPGTLTLGGAFDNSSFYLAVSNGALNLAKTGATTRAVAGITSVASGSTVTITGAGGDQIYGGGAGGNFGVNGLAGTLDLNGFSESTSNFGGTSTGVLTNSAASTNAVWTVGETNATTQTFAGVIQDGAGTISLVKIGTGTQTLSGANTYTGSTTLNAGTLVLDYGTEDNSKLGNAGALVLNGGTLQLAGATGSHVETVGAVTINGPVSITRNGANTAKIALGNFTNNSGLNLATGDLATTTVANNGSGYLTGVTIGGTQLAMNDLSLGGGLGNIVPFSGSYTDVTRLSSGTKVIPNSPGSFVRIIDGTGTAANITVPAGTSDIDLLLQTATGGATTVALTGTLRLGADGGITSSAGMSALTIQGGILTAGGATDTAGTLTAQNTSTNAINITSQITNNGIGAVALKSTGSVTLGNTTTASTNNFTGGTTVNGGTLTVSTPVAAGAKTGLGTGAVTVNNGTLTIFTASTTNAQSYANNIVLNNGTLNSQDGNLTYSGTVSLQSGTNNTINVVWGPKTATFTNAISGAGNLTITNTGGSAGGVAILSGTNTYTGNTTVASGVLTLSGTGSLNSGSYAGTITNNGTFNWNSSTAQALTGTLAGTGAYNFNAGSTTLSGGGTGTGSVRIVPTAAGTTLGITTGTYAFSGLALYQDTINNSTATYNQSGGNVTVSGTFQLGASSVGNSSGNTNTANITGGTLTVGTLHGYKWATNNMNINGGASVTAGTFQIGHVDSSPTLNLDVGNGTTAGTLAWGATSVSTTRNVTLDLNMGTIQATATNANWISATMLSSLTVKDSGGTIHNGGFNIGIGQVISHAGVAATDGGLLFDGAGATTVTGANTYTGTTTVSNGTLLVSNTTGSGTGTGAVTVQSGATLGGTGTISGTVAAAGTIAPGAGSIATLSTGSLTLTGTYAAEVNGANADRITVTGNLTLQSGSTLALTTANVTLPYVLASYTGTLSGGFTTVTGLPAGAALVHDSAAKQIKLVAATPYTDWAAENGLTLGNSDKVANPDGDALNNLLEFAFGTDPLSGTSGPITFADGVVTAAGTPTTKVTNLENSVDFRAVFGRRKDYVAAGLTYTVQFSAGLDEWVEIEPAPTPTLEAEGDEIDAVSVPYPLFIQTVNGMEKPTFFRVSVSEAP